MQGILAQRGVIFAVLIRVVMDLVVVPGRGASLVVANGFQIEPFDLAAGPLGFAKKFEARLDAGVIRKAANGDSVAQTFPSVLLDQVL